MMALAYLLAVAPPVVVTMTQPASEVSFQVSGTCGANSITLSDYGASSSGQTTIEVNGNPAEGIPLAELFEFLSHQKALYRIGVRCVEGEMISLGVKRAEQNAAGETEFTYFIANFRGNRLVGRGAGPDSEDSFFERPRSR